jgi:V/A-type H+-transporting ATPase subunit E
MASIKKGLEAMASEILEDIKNEAEKIIRDAEKEGEDTLRKAREEAKRTSVRLLAEAKEKGEIEKKKMRSLAEMEVRNKFLQVKEELVNTVFDKALARLRQFVEAESYHDYLLKSIQEAVEKLDSDTLVVYVNFKDKEWLAQGKLDKLSGKLGVKLVLANKTENCLGGCVVKTPDEKMSYDNTFEKRLQRLKPVLRTRVAKILFEKED